MLTLRKQRRRDRIEALGRSCEQIRKHLEDLSKENPNHDPKDGEFTSGSGGSSSDSKDSKEGGSKSDSKGSGKEEDKPSAGLFRKLVGVVLAVKGGAFVGGAVGTALMLGVGLSPIVAAAGAAGVGLYVGGKIYNAVTKSEIAKAGSKSISFKSDEDGKKFLHELPKHLSPSQMKIVTAKLQALKGS